MTNVRIIGELWNVRGFKGSRCILVDVLSWQILRGTEVKHDKSQAGWCPNRGQKQVPYECKSIVLLHEPTFPAPCSHSALYCTLFDTISALLVLRLSSATNVKFYENLPFNWSQHQFFHVILSPQVSWGPSCYFFLSSEVLNYDYFCRGFILQ